MAVRRGRGGDRGDARLLPVAAGQGECRLIQAFHEASQLRGLKVAGMDELMLPDEGL